jgi:hypothetical protein
MKLLFSTSDPPQAPRHARSRELSELLAGILRDASPLARIAEHYEQARVLAGGPDRHRSRPVSRPAGL